MFERVEALAVVVGFDLATGKSFGEDLLGRARAAGAAGAGAAPGAWRCGVWEVCRMTVSAVQMIPPQNATIMIAIHHHPPFHPSFQYLCMVVSPSLICSCEQTFVTLAVPPLIDYRR